MTRRLLLGYLAITLMVLGVLAVPLGFSFQSRALQAQTNRLVQDAFVEASRAQQSAIEKRMPPDVEEGIRNFAEVKNVRVVVVDVTGHSLLDTAPTLEGETGLNFADRKEIRDVLDKGSVSTGQRYSRTLGSDLVYVAVPIADHGKVVGSVRLTFATTPIDREVRRYWLFLATTAIVSLGAVTVFGILLARSLAKPITELEHAAVAFGSGDIGRRSPTDRGPDEVRSLARTFNRTAERLQELLTSQEAFVADASHQLRTPLTGLRLRLENLEPDVAIEARDDLSAAVVEVDRLARLVDGLLTLARVDRDEVAPPVPLEIRPFLDERAETWSPFAEERSVTLTVSCAPGLWALADNDRFTQVVDNLVANALDALGGNGAIHLWAEPVAGTDDMVEIHVTDNGPGMSDTERERAFDRFWRADSRRRTTFGGSGLGLAIVAKLVHADRGKVRLDATPGGGLDAVVTFPAPALLPPPEGERRRRALYR